MAFSELSIYNALMGSIIVIIGFIFALLIFKYYLSSKNTQTLALSIMVLGASSGWIIEFLNLIQFILGGNLISGKILVYFFHLLFM